MTQTRSVYSPLYNATPAEPDSTPFRTTVSPDSALRISKRVRGYGVGMLRIAHNSLYALANKLGDPMQDTAHQARERLWAEILIRDRM